MSRTADWDLVAQAKAGDMEAFAGLVRRYQAPVIQFCFRMTGSAQDAEDIAQESFVRVYRHLPRLKPQAKFSTLLFGIARNLALNFLRDSARRDRGRTQPLMDVAHAGPERLRPDEAARRQEIETMIEQGLERLSAEHREILILREMNGMDYETIAGVVDCEIGTVKSRLARAREQLRVHLLDLGGAAL